MEESTHGSPIFGIILVLVMLGFGVGIHFLVSDMINEYQEYKIYKDFCEQRPNFCYCSFDSGGCEFKTSWSSITGLSNDTLELCDLATKLNDKETLFKVSCP